MGGRRRPYLVRGWVRVGGRVGVRVGVRVRVGVGVRVRVRVGVRVRVRGGGGRTPHRSAAPRTECSHLSVAAARLVRGRG